MTTQNSSELKQASLVYALQRCQLFAGLPQEELREIADFTIIKPVAKGSYLFHEGDKSHGFYIVQKGAISVHRVNAAGKEQVIHIFREGESFAEGSLATPAGYPADALAVETSQVLLVQKNDMLSLLARRPELGLRMLGAMSKHLRDLVGQIEDLTLKDVETRLANWLIKRCPDPGSEEPFKFELTTTKQVLASEIGTISATLSRTIARLRDNGLLEIKGKSVTIPCPAKLLGLFRARLGD